MHHEAGVLLSRLGGRHHWDVLRVLVRRELLYVSALALGSLSSVVNARPSLAPLMKQAHHITQRPAIIGSLGQAYSESPTPLHP
jgi:hypothetical protein